MSARPHVDESTFPVGQAVNDAPEAASGRFPRSLVGRPAQANHSGMPAVRALLLLVVAFLFVGTVSLVFIGDTGPLEKLVLLVVPVLLALLVPQTRRLGGPATP